MNSSIYTLLLVAFLARLISVLFFPVIYHSDELFQYFEQGYRLIEGYGVVPWEYHAGVRSWILPGILAGFKVLVDLFSDNPEHYFYFTNLVLSILSLSTVYVVYKSVSARAEKKFAAAISLIPALFPLYFLFAPRVLTEVVAGHLLLLGIFWLSELERNSSRKFCLLLGFVLGLSFILRFHLAVGIALPILFFLRNGYSRNYHIVLLGGLAIIMFAGILDWITLGAPFQSIAMNIYMNVGLDIASQFGQVTLYELISAVPGGTIGFLVFLLLFSYLFFAGWRGNELYALMFIGIIIPHLLIAHKEWRFFYPALTPMLIIVSVGFYRISKNFNLPLLDLIVRPASVAILVLLINVSGYVAFYQAGWLAKGKAHFELASTLRSSQNLQILGVDENIWWETTSYALLGKNIPIIVDGIARQQSESVRSGNSLYKGKVPYDLKIVARWKLSDEEIKTNDAQCIETGLPGREQYDYCIITTPPELISRSENMITLNERLENDWKADSK